MLLEPAELTGPPPRERRPALCAGQSVQTVTAAGEAAERCRGAAAAMRGTRPVGGADVEPEKQRSSVARPGGGHPSCFSTQLYNRSPAQNHEGNHIRCSQSACKSG